MEALFNLRNVYIKFPITKARTGVCVETFQDVSDLPNIVDAIDGSHIRIAAPPDSAVDYFSHYQQHEFIVQAIVDGKKRFLDFALGFSGSAVLFKSNDSEVLRIFGEIWQSGKVPFEISFKISLVGVKFCWKFHKWDRNFRGNFVCVSKILNENFIGVSLPCINCLFFLQFGLHLQITNFY